MNNGMRENPGEGIHKDEKRRQWIALVERSGTSSDVPPVYCFCRSGVRPLFQAEPSAKMT